MPDGDRPNVRQREVVARQRLALDHGASVSLGPSAPGPRRYSSSRRSSSTLEASKPSIRSAAPAAATAAPAGIRPTSSDPTTSAPRVRGLSLDARHDLVQRRGLEVLDVHAHLDEPGPRQLEPERPHPGEAAVPLADERRDLPRGFERPR